MSHIAVLRILDASLNRAAEGLRVVEDYVRFVLDDPFLTAQTKSLRHDLTGIATSLDSAHRHAARDTRHDVGTVISTPAEANRSDAWAVCAASLKRIQQSLRSIEEYSKLVAPSVGTQAESLRYKLYTLEKAIDTGRTSHDRLAQIRLCVLVDGGRSEAEFESIVTALVTAGPLMIQLRDKKLDDRQLATRARTLVALVHPKSEHARQPPALPGVESEYGQNVETSPAEPGADGREYQQTLAIINDRADIAAAVGADGVHLGQDDLSVKDARNIVGPHALIGVSTHNIDQARSAVLDGANYLGAGPTFPSKTKSFEAFAGLAYLQAVATEIHLPTFAIGGINAGNLSDVLATGISRVAVSSAITTAPIPASAAQTLSDILWSES